MKTDTLRATLFFLVLFMSLFVSVLRVRVRVRVFVRRGELLVRPDAAQRGFAGVSAEEVCEERGGVVPCGPCGCCERRGGGGVACGFPALAFCDLPPA